MFESVSAITVGLTEHCGRMTPTVLMSLPDSEIAFSSPAKPLSRNA